MLYGCLLVLDGASLTRSISVRAAIQVFPVGQHAPTPQAIIGRMTAYSCKWRVWDPPASRDAALEQLQIRALRTGANALINVSFKDLSTTCWHMVQVSGTAVHLATAK
jgi:uncharacterized protein YbjQ (UPF0145 family)